MHSQISIRVICTKFWSVIYAKGMFINRIELSIANEKYKMDRQRYISVSKNKKAIEAYDLGEERPEEMV